MSSARSIEQADEINDQFITERLKKKGIVFSWIKLNN